MKKIIFMIALLCFIIMSSVLIHHLLNNNIINNNEKNGLYYNERAAYELNKYNKNGINFANDIYLNDENIKALPFYSWTKSSYILDISQSSPIVDEDINEFFFINFNSISKYEIMDDEINYMFTIENDNNININDFITESSFFIYEYNINNTAINYFINKNNINNNHNYIYGYNVTGQELVFTIDILKTYCQIFINDERECNIGQVDYSGRNTSMGIISITNKGIMTIMETNNPANPFNHSPGVIETYGNNELTVYSHFSPLKYFKDDDNDDVNKFIYNFKSYMDDLYTYDFSSIDNHIFNSAPLIHYKDWPHYIFLNFMLRDDLYPYKKTIIEYLENEESKNSSLLVFNLAQLSDMVINKCSNFKIPIEVCKKLTRLWFYLHIIEKIPHNINIIIVKKDMDLRRNKIISLSRSRLM